MRPGYANVENTNSAGVKDTAKNAGKKDGKEQTGKTRENIGFNVIQLSLFPMS